MTARLRRRTVAASIIAAAIALLALAPGAFASATAGFDIGDLVVTGADAADDEINVTYDQPNDRYVVADAVGGVIPGSGCTTAGAPASTAFCPRPSTTGRTILVRGEDPENLDHSDDGNDLIKVAYGSSLPAGDTATIVGVGGNDSLFGSPAQDFISGGLGNDFIDASGGPDEITGGGGEVTPTDSAGDDQLYGGPGSDTIDDGEGNGASSTVGADRLDGSGCTTLIDPTCLDEPDLPADQDTIDWADRTGSNFVDLSFIGTPLGGSDPPQGELGENNTILSVESVNTGSGSDNLTGDGGDNSFNAGEGTNTVRGGGGADGITGGANHDNIDGQAGSDTIDAKAGDDLVTANDGTTDTIDCGSGGETTGDTVHEDTFDTVNNCEHRDLGGGNPGPQSGPPPAIRGGGVYGVVDGGFIPRWNLTTQGKTTRVDLYLGRPGGALSFYAGGDFAGYPSERLIGERQSTIDAGSAPVVKGASLLQNTTYNFQARVTNANGSSSSAMGTFTTANPKPKSAYWFTAFPHKVFLAGKVDLAGLGSSCRFEYVELAGFKRTGWKHASQDPPATDPFNSCANGRPDGKLFDFGSDPKPTGSPKALPQSGRWIDGLKAGTTYRYRLVMRAPFQNGLMNLDADSFHFTTASEPKPIPNGVQMTVPIPVGGSGVDAGLYVQDECFDGTGHIRVGKEEVCARRAKFRRVGRFKKRRARAGGLKFRVKLAKGVRKQGRLRGHKVFARLVVKIKPPQHKGKTVTIRRRVKIPIR